MIDLAQLPLNQRKPRAPGTIARGMTQKQYARWWYLQNKARFKEQGADYYKRNSERYAERNHRYWRSLTREQKEARRVMCPIKKARNAQRSAEWKKKNVSKVRGYLRKHQAKIMATPKGRVDHRMSVQILQCLKARKGGWKWESLVGYALSDLMRHLESKFKPGMSWSRLMRGHIHIDHVIPKSKFNYTSPTDTDFKRCWALENLAPEWKRNNIIKSDRILIPSQIPLGV